MLLDFWHKQVWIVDNPLIYDRLSTHIFCTQSCLIINNTDLDDIIKRNQLYKQKHSADNHRALLYDVVKL